MDDRSINGCIMISATPINIITHVISLLSGRIKVEVGIYIATKNNDSIDMVPSDFDRVSSLSCLGNDSFFRIIRFIPKGERVPTSIAKEDTPTKMPKLSG